MKLLMPCAMLLVVLLSSACSSETVIEFPVSEDAPLAQAEPARENGHDAATAPEEEVAAVPDSVVPTVVRETTFLEFLEAQDVSQPFERAIYTVGDLRLNSDIIIYDEWIVETPALTGWGLRNGRPPNETLFFVAPAGERPKLPNGATDERPDAIGITLNLTTGLRLSGQQVLLASLALTDQQAIAERVVAHIANGVSQGEDFDGAAYTVRITDLITGSDGSLHKTVTFVWNDASVSHEDVDQAAQQTAAGLTGPRPVAQSELDSINFNDHLFAAHSDIRFGMSEHQVESLIGDFSYLLAVSFRSTGGQDFGELGSALYTFYTEVGLSEVVHQFVLPEEQIYELAVATFGEPDPAMPNLRELSREFRPVPETWRGQWLVPVPGHGDVWAIATTSAIIIRSLEPGAEHEINPEALAAAIAAGGQTAEPTPSPLDEQVWFDASNGQVPLFTTGVGGSCPSAAEQWVSGFEIGVYLQDNSGVADMSTLALTSPIVIATATIPQTQAWQSLDEQLQGHDNFHLLSSGNVRSAYQLTVFSFDLPSADELARLELQLASLIASARAVDGVLVVTDSRCTDNVGPQLVDS